MCVLNLKNKWWIWLQTRVSGRTLTHKFIGEIHTSSIILARVRQTFVNVELAIVPYVSRWIMMRFKSTSTVTSNLGPSILYLYSHPDTNNCNQQYRLSTALHLGKVKTNIRPSSSDTEHPYNHQHNNKCTYYND